MSCSVSTRTGKCWRARPLTACFKDHVDLVRCIVAEDRRLTREELGEKTCIRISNPVQETQQKIFAEWLPHLSWPKSKKQCESYLPILFCKACAVNNCSRTVEVNSHLRWNLDLFLRFREDSKIPKKTSLSDCQAHFSIDKVSSCFVMLLLGQISTHRVKIYLARRKRPLVNDVIVHHDNAAVHTVCQVMTRLGYAWE